MPVTEGVLDPQTRRFLAMVGLSGRGNAAGAPAIGIAERRASFGQLMRFSQPPATPVATSTFHVSGCGGAIPLRLYVPQDALTPGPGLVFFHGGGLVAGDLDTHDALCRTLCIGSRCRLLAVEYRLAPEHPFPAAIVDALRTTRYVLRHASTFGLELTNIGVGGDSGGATLAAVVAQLVGAPRLKAQILLCPLLDQSAPTVSREAYRAGYMLDAETLAADLSHYAPTRPLADGYVSPLHAADLHSAPPAWIHVAGFDPLRDEGIAYATRLRDAGVAAHLTCHESLIHGFYALTGALAAAGSALDDIANDIACALN